MKHVLLAACLAGGATGAFGQTTTPSSRDLIATTRERIRVLDHRLLEIGDDWQRQLDAANCRVSCPPELVDRLGTEMPIAMDMVLSHMHAEVERFVLRTANTGRADLNSGNVAKGLQEILPMNGLPRAAFVVGARGHRSLIVVYALLRGQIVTPNGTSVAIRAYRETPARTASSGSSATGLMPADVADDDMNGYGGLEITELHAPVKSKLFLLMSGRAMGANGPNTRMRLYEYDGMRFTSVWTPDNVWGAFEVKATVDGFTVEGDYYRENERRSDRYLLSDKGGVTDVTLLLNSGTR
jgi:hypothetical protein